MRWNARNICCFQLSPTTDGHWIRKRAKSCFAVLRLADHSAQCRIRSAIDSAAKAGATLRPRSPARPSKTIATSRRNSERLERWADDMVLGAEKELADTKAQIKAVNRQARLATTLAEQHDLQLKLRDLERQQRRQRQRIFDVEDEIKDKLHQAW